MLFCFSLQYLGKTHNSWHRAGLMLEDYATQCDDYLKHQISQQQQLVIDFSPFEEDPTEINQHVSLSINVLDTARVFANNFICENRVTFL